MGKTKPSAHIKVSDISIKQHYLHDATQLGHYEVKLGQYTKSTHGQVA